MSEPARFARRQDGGPKPRPDASAFALVLWLVPGFAAAGAPPSSVIPYSGQSQVNTTASGDQQRPAVSPLPGGGWVVAWWEVDSGVEVVRCRVVSRGGQPTGLEVSLDEGLAYGPPAVARLDDGRSIVVWRVVVGSDTGVRGRFLTAAGAATGGILPLQAVGAGLINPTVDVASAAGGGFVATWTNSTSVSIRRFDAAGTPLAAAQAADTLGGPFKDNPRIARLVGSGGHVVVWESTLSAGGDAGSLSVQWRRLEPSGAWVGIEQQANSYIMGNQMRPDVAPTPDGGFAILWSSNPDAPRAPDGEPIGDGIDLRRFRSAGTPRGAEVTISTNGSPPAHDPVLAAGRDGDLVASWVEDDMIVARRLGASSAIGSVFQVDDYFLASNPAYPAVAVDDEGDLAIAWQSVDSPGNDTSGLSVQVRTFTAGRVAHWRFEEGSGELAFDDAGLYPDDATLAGDGIQWSWGRPGSMAIAFAGLGYEGWADVSPSSDLDIADRGLTLTAWLYLESAPSDLFEPFASIYDAAQDNYVLYVDRDNQELRFKVTDSNGTTERPGIPEAMVPLYRWFHVAGVYRADIAAAEIYLDGELVDFHPNAGFGDPVRSTPAQIAAMGRDGEIARYYFDGRIEEIEVWRRGLSQEEIRMVRGGYLFGDGFERGSTLGWSNEVP